MRDDAPHKETGRPPKFKAEMVQQAARLCSMMAATDRELAEFFDVGLSTFYAWKIKYPALAEACRAAKSVANDRVRHSLYERAMGYEYEDTDIRVINKKIVKTKVMRKMPPCATSMIFWLKNREPDKWRDKQELEVDLKGNLAEELAQARRRAKDGGDAKE